MRIDKRALAAKLTKSPALEKIVEAKKRAQFNAAKAQLIQDFENHPVTKEIAGGVNATNVSGTLGGRGNLFTFIGFPAESNPTQVVRSILRTRLRLVKTGKRTKGETSQFFFKVLIPEDELRAATPMPFESGNSWLFDIEQGISGFSNYVYGKFGDSSRSGGGIQAEKAQNGGSFTPVSYITELLRKFSISLHL